MPTIALVDDDLTVLDPDDCTRWAGFEARRLLTLVAQHGNEVARGLGIFPLLNILHGVAEDSQRDLELSLARH